MVIHRTRRYGMRFLLKVSLPVETGNEAIKGGTLPQTIESILNDIKPEAAYFAEENGKRTWFLAFNAQVEFHPAMNLQDLKNAAPGIERAVKNYHSLKKAA